MRKLPIEESADQMIDAIGAIVLSEQDFERALLESQDPPKDLEAYFYTRPVDGPLRHNAARLGGMANKLGTLGIVSIVEQESDLQYFNGNLFFVVQNPEFGDRGRRLQATEYKIVSLELGGRAKWIGHSVQFAVNSSLQVGGRCCGPAVVCKPDDNNPVNPYFDRTLEVGVTGTPIPDLDKRNESGTPLIDVVPSYPPMNPPGGPHGQRPLLIPQKCINLTSKLCASVKPICEPDDEGAIGGDGGGDGEGNPGMCGVETGGMKIMPGNLIIPEWCKYVLTEGPSECQGYRPSYTNQGGSGPRICQLVRFVGPENPCNPASKVPNDLSLRVQTGWTPGRSTRQCQPVSGGPQWQSNVICASCDEEGNCVETIETSPYSPVAVGAGNNGDGGATEAEEASKPWEGHDPTTTKEYKDWLENEKKFNEDVYKIDWFGFPKKSSSPASSPNEVVFEEDEGLIITAEPPKPEPPKPPRETIPFIPEYNRDPRFRNETESSPQSGRTNQESEKPQNKTKPPKGDPVDLGDGSLAIEHTDLQFSGPVYPLSFTRYYRSQSSYRSLLGSNWTYNWDARIVPITADNAPSWVSPWCYEIYGHIRAVLLYDSGITELYVLDELTKLYLPQSGAYSTIIRTSEGGWAKREPDGRIKVFDADGYLISDRDRLGNGFSIEYEPTPLFELYQAFCGPGKLTNPLERISRRFFLLGYMVGEISRPTDEPFQFDLDSGSVLSEQDFNIVPPNQSASVTAPVSGQATGFYTAIDQDEYDRLEYARAYLIHLSEIAARVDTAGMESVDGYRKKRPVKVTDDVENTLNFEYHQGKRNNAGKYDFDASPEAGLMKTVKGSLGTTVSFGYSRPAKYPAELNEAFLTRVDRVDVNVNAANTEPGLPRYYEFEYSPESIRSPLSYNRHAGNVENKYFEFYQQIFGCCSEACGQLNIFGLPVYSAFKERNEYISNVADKIITITNTGHIEAETRYIIDPFDQNFGKVSLQRYGNSKKGKKSPRVDRNVWKTTMPLMSFDYQDAGPDGLGGDLTDKFLPEVLKKRYDFDEADVNKLSFKDDELPEPIPEVVSTEKCKTSDRPPCNYLKGEFLRRQLPGYRLEYQVYELKKRKEYPAFNDSLYRTRLSPAQLRFEQFSDPAHNDLVSILKERNQANGTVEYLAERLIGGRKKVKVNSNRLCSWVKTVDRDGVVNYFGMNYRGQALVEAVLESNGEYVVTERTVNADGLVIQERRPTAGSVDWRPINGYTLFKYDEIEPTGWNEWLPAFWSRRKNLVQWEEYAADEQVWNDDENGNFHIGLGRYESFSYEPLFNQLEYNCKGYIEPSLPSADGKKRVKFVKYWETIIVFDYQELTLDATKPQDGSLIPALEELRKWGYSWATDANGNLDLNILSSWQLPVPLFEKDLNQDDVQGYSFHSNPSQRARALPILIISRKPDTVIHQVTMLQWAPHGRPSLILRPDGELDLFEYFSASKTSTNNPFGTLQQLTADEISVGYKGFLARHSRLRLYDTYPQLYGPPTFPEKVFRGPYQWFSPGNGNPAQIMASMGFPLEIIEDLEHNAGFGSNQGGNWLRTEYLYNEGGEPMHVITDTATSTMIRDTDDRVKKMTDPAGTNTIISYNYQGMPDIIHQYDKNGNQIGEGAYEYDVEVNLLSETHRTGENSQIIQKYDYSPDGLLMQIIDPEGLPIDHRYNARKLLTGKVAKISNAADFRGIAFKYDLDGRVTGVHYGVKTDNDQGILFEQFIYDGLGRVVTRRDKRGYFWQTAYSGRDLKTRQAQRDLPYSDAVLPPAVWELIHYYNELLQPVSFYLNGQLIFQQLWTIGGKIYSQTQLGETPNRVTFDLLGRPAWRLENNGNETIYTYREKPFRIGQATIRRSAAGQTAVTSYVSLLDPRGLVEEIKSYGKTDQDLIMIKQIFEYDGRGNQISQTNHLGDAKKTEYNWLNWITAEEENTSLPGVVDRAEFEYNKRGQLEVLTDPSRYKTTHYYNVFGESIGQVSDGKPDVEIATLRDRLGRIEIRRENNVTFKTTWNDRGDPISESIVTIVPNGNQVQIPFILRDFDELGRLLYTKHINPALQGLSEKERTVEVRRQYDRLGRLLEEGITVGGRAEIAVRSVWQINNSYHWDRHGFYRASAWSDHFVDTYDGGGRLISKKSFGGQSFIFDTYFDWLGDWTTGRQHSLPGRQSPFREKHKLDGFGLPSQIAYTVIDLLTNGQPRFPAEAATNCPGGWNPVLCGRPLLAIDIIRNALGRVGSLHWQFGHLLNDPLAQHPRFWRGYTYTPQEFLNSVWEQDDLVTQISGVKNYAATPTVIQNIGQSASAMRWNYKREQHVGSPLAITNASDGTARWNVPANASRGKGHQLTAVEVNGKRQEIEHNGLGQVSKYGEHYFEYHYYLQQLASVRNPNMVLESYLFDAEGRMVSVLKYPGDPRKQQQEFFLYDGMQLAGSFDEKLTPIWLAAWGPKLDQLVQWTDYRSSGTTIPLVDHRNSVVSLWRLANQQLTGLTNYNPEGRVVTSRPDYSLVSDEQISGGVAPISNVPGLPFGFTSAWRSEITGLIWMRNRWYSPALGQFLSRDARRSIDNFNEYAYVAFDPINFTDPFGLEGQGFVNKTLERYKPYVDTVSNVLNLLSFNLDQLEKRVSRYLEEAKKGLKNTPYPKIKNPVSSAQRRKMKKGKKGLAVALKNVEEAKKHLGRVKIAAKVITGLSAGNATIDQYIQSTAQTEPGKIIDALIGGAGVSLATEKLGLIDTIDDFVGATPLKDLTIQSTLQTSVRSGVTLVEAVITGDTTGPELFHERSKSGEYGPIFQGASKIGEFINVGEAAAEAVEYLEEKGLSGAWEDVKERLKSND